MDGDFNNGTAHMIAMDTFSSQLLEVYELSSAFPGAYGVKAGQPSKL